MFKNLTRPMRMKPREIAGAFAEPKQRCFGLAATEVTLLSRCERLADNLSTITNSKTIKAFPNFLYREFSLCMSATPSSPSIQGRYATRAYRKDACSVADDD
jgi:hypothetical protein